MTETASTTAAPPRDRSGAEPDPTALRALVRRMDIRVRSIVVAMVTALVFAAFEVIGLSMMIPLVQYIQAGGHTAELHGIVFKLLGRTGLPITVTTLLLGAMVPAVLRQAAQYLRESVVWMAQHRTAQHLRSRLVDAYLGADISFFVESRQGDLLNRLSLDSHYCGEAARALLGMAAAALVLTVNMTALCIVSWRLTLLAVPLFTVLALLFKSKFRVGRSLGDRFAGASAEFSFQIAQGLQAMRLIKMSGGEGALRDRFGTSIDAIEDFGWRVDRNRIALESMSQPLFLAGIFALLIAAVDGLNIGLGELGLFMAVVLRCLPQVIQFNAQRMIVTSAVPCLERIEATIDQATASTSIASGRIPFERLSHSLRFDDVHFAYPGAEDRMVLDGLDFTVGRGETVALVGRSGAGKSTAIDLIPRLYEPTRGRVTLDGVPLADYDLASLRRRIAFVSQEPILLHDTVRANLTFGLAAPVAEDELWRCLGMAQAADFIAHIGLDTVIGERGFRLSGGQRQRLTLARALLQQPEILILDEPTASLDTISEEAIKTALDQLRHRLTILMVAHRLSTIQSADRIVVLAQGRAVATGRHAELVERSALYRELYAAQQPL